jgi:hypothetical protein
LTDSAQGRSNDSNYTNTKPEATRNQDPGSHTWNKSAEPSSPTDGPATNLRLSAST